MFQYSSAKMTNQLRQGTFQQAHGCFKALLRFQHISEPSCLQILCLFVVLIKYEELLLLLCSSLLASRQEVINSPNGILTSALLWPETLPSFLPSVHPPSFPSYFYILLFQPKPKVVKEKQQCQCNKIKTTHTRRKQITLKNWQDLPALTFTITSQAFKCQLFSSPYGILETWFLCLADIWQMISWNAPVMKQHFFSLAKGKHA